jgi:type II secretory pathway pseudopilin PulG
MVVVVVIGLLAAMAIPAFQRVQTLARISRVANDFRIFAQAFETHSMQTGGWPPNAGSGAIPSGMAGSFKEDVWRARTAIGGRWNWELNRSGIVAGISIAGFTCTEETLLAIDAKLDDGNLGTGTVRLTTSDRFTYILE